MYGKRQDFLQPVLRVNFSNTVRLTDKKHKVNFLNFIIFIWT
jgi:hypothetical protein